jgi:hypothetical protein
MHMGCQQGWTGRQTLEHAESMGMKLESPQVREFVRRYVDSHTA